MASAQSFERGYVYQITIPVGAEATMVVSAGTPYGAAEEAEEVDTNFTAQN
jgi:hypothetical protein